jgi:hypothetical protein
MNATIETILDNARSYTRLGRLQSVTIAANGEMRALYEHGSISFDAEGEPQMAQGNPEAARLLADEAAGRLIHAR